MAFSSSRACPAARGHRDGYGSHHARHSAEKPGDHRSVNAPTQAFNRQSAISARSFERWPDAIRSLITSRFPIQQALEPLIAPDAGGTKNVVQVSEVRRRLDRHFHTLRNGMAQWPGDAPFDRLARRWIAKGEECNLPNFVPAFISARTWMRPGIFSKGSGMEAMPIEAAVGRARVIVIQDPELIQVRELEPYRVARPAPVVQN